MLHVLLSTVVHSASAGFDWAAAAGAVVALVALVLGGIWVRKYVQAQNIKAQLDAKDAVIETNTQLINAFEIRIHALEAEVKDMRFARSRDADRIKDLEAQIREWETKYSLLQQYAAPEAVQRFENILGLHAESLTRHDANLKRLAKLLETHIKE